MNKMRRLVFTPYFFLAFSSLFRVYFATLTRYIELVQIKQNQIENYARDMLFSYLKKSALIISKLCFKRKKNLMEYVKRLMFNLHNVSYAPIFYKKLIFENLIIVLTWNFSHPQPKSKILLDNFLEEKKLKYSIFEKFKIQHFLIEQNKKNLLTRSLPVIQGHTKIALLYPALERDWQ